MAYDQKNNAKASLLFISTDEFMQNFESKTHTNVFVLDFSKTFDVFPHQRLLHKLDHYGIWGTTLNWIRNFLTNRTQKVVVIGSSSESACVKSGVPKGTVLGRLLFFTYIMLSPDGKPAIIKKTWIQVHPECETQQTWHIYLMFDQCWANVVDGGPTLVKHWVDVSCLLGTLENVFINTIRWCLP